MANKYKNIGYDYDGVASEGVFEDGGVIITGRPEGEKDEILETLGDKKPSAIHFFPEDKDANGNNLDVKIGIWKAKTIKKLGLEKFYEDSEEQIYIIKEMNPNLNVIKVIDGIPQEKLNLIVFTFDGTILPVAHKLEQEGNRVIVGIIEDKKKTLLPDEDKSPEDPEMKKKRLSNYTGIMDLFDADEVLKTMKRIKDKENWIILTDSNSNYQYTEKALEMGFTKGIFPTEWDRGMEVNRNDAKEFVKEFYPDIKVAEVKTFKDIEEAKVFLGETDEFWVLKSLGDAGETIVPDSEDCEMAKNQIIAALDEMKSEYESHGFILEMKIQNMIEITPEIIFIDGAPICTSVDIENKGIGAGNTGIQTGCMQNLIVRTNIEDRINKIAFPEKVYELAKEHAGMFVWDISLLIDKEGTMWYGEFCSNRLGWDAFPTELAMAADDEGDKVATPFFSALMVKKNPFRFKYGAGVRMLNIGRGGKMIADGSIEISDEAAPYTFAYDAKMGKEECIVSNGGGFDLAVVTCGHDNSHEAIEGCYEYVEGFLFEGKYFRPRFDFCSYEYESSIMNRLQFAIGHGLIDTDEGSNTLSEPSNRY